MKYFLTVILSIFILLGCKKDEELISGDIEGSVHLVQSDYTSLPAIGDIQVDLFSNSVKINSMKTDGNGEFIFTGLPYGRYSIRCSYPGFIRSYIEQPIFHVGGYSATLADDYLYHVPEYQIHIDSITYDSVDYFIKLHMKVDGDTLAPEGKSFFHQFRAFMSNSPDVSSENYAVIAKGIVADWPMYNAQSKVAVYGRVMIYDGPSTDWESINSEPIYMVLYPIANNQGYLPEEYLPGSLGPPSNEISFDPVIVTVW